MAIVSGTVSIAAASSSGNVLNNTDFQFIQGPAIISLYLSTENYAEQEIDFLVGSMEILRGGRANTEAAAGQVNRDTDLVVDRQLIPPGRHLVRLISTNTDAANAERFNYLMQVDQP